MSRETDQDWNDAFGDPRAAEYVLGTLPAEERAAFAEAMEQDRALADMTDAWASRLSAMNSVYGEIDPPSSIKASLDRRLFASSASSVASSSARPGRWWPFLGGLVSGLAVASLALLAMPLADLSPFERGEDIAGQTPQVEPSEGHRMVASLAPNESEAGFVALWEGHSRTLNFTRISGASPSEGVYEIWVIHEGADPVSLGLLPDENVAHMVMPQAHADLMTDDATLAVSHEPDGGSPTGLPTGPVVAAGHVQGI
ncbi:anti-sigma factor domain-containing protein [Notoacmeibacter sp. MSK16QG-6]|uniref:anti-sigma factor n=1 Tax=Notoacmeibacter sp. MSK16QG-6 TaxID=2957982 RepID=UPI00209D4D6E|nr:anti-sigma factor [Notoacmeibacter sp. MSK16QG-6]MCP1198719.1 anti-sigma factor [Notoacmeibacter sp. MSK16QG-6]